MVERKGLVLGGAAALVLAAPGVAVAAPASQDPVVVELFTSQGCSSCPPANANLITVSDRPGVLALSFGVTYWDYLGWKDSFAKPEFTQRQYSYERTLHEASAYTPQMVVNGETDLVGNAIGDVERAIAGERDAAAKRPVASVPAITLGSGTVDVAAARAPDGGADVWLVRYDPNLVQVPVAQGENGGRTLPHKNVVHDLVRLGGWAGAAKHFALPPATSGMKTAILVQSSYGGEIIAAATD
ncbi:MAG TPA: DUF1223 domain-containing protein [Dongiaceae bacterium]|nr:DUF1223 domain-containing protein [Dongiaceae bacterium]